MSLRSCKAQKKEPAAPLLRALSTGTARSPSVGGEGGVEFCEAYVYMGQLQKPPQLNHRAFELASGADFSCKMMCGAGPVDLAEALGRNLCDEMVRIIGSYACKHCQIISIPFVRQVCCSREQLSVQFRLFVEV